MLVLVFAFLGFDHLDGQMTACYNVGLYSGRRDISGGTRLPPKRERDVDRMRDAQRGKVPLDRIWPIGWLVYFISYFTRYNYSAAMVAIAEAEGFDTGMTGLIASALFVCYGAGQMIAGWLGERCDPRRMVFAGLFGSAICNGVMGLSGSYPLMLAAWGLNGLMCAMIWAPMVRLLTLVLPYDRQRRAMLSFSYSTALGQAGTYLLVSFLTVWLPWRYAFFVPTVLAAAVALLWLFSVPRDCAAEALPGPAVDDAPAAAAPGTARRGRVWLISGLPAILCAILLMGVLKDGILTWVPQMVKDTFGTSTSLSIFLSAVLPVVTVASVPLVKLLCRLCRSDDMIVSAVLYGGAAVGMLLLLLFGGTSPAAAIVLFSLVATLVSGVNAVLISFIPLRYAAFGLTAVVAGLTNAVTYLGSALSGFGIGAVAQHGGWRTVEELLLALCVAGIVCCAAIRPVWRRFCAADPNGEN